MGIARPRVVYQPVFYGFKHFITHGIAGRLLQAVGLTGCLIFVSRSIRILIFFLPVMISDTSTHNQIPFLRRAALLFCIFLITAVFGIIQPFVPLYLEASGLRRDQIGLVTGLGTGAALLIQMLFGKLSDLLDARRPFMCAAAIVSGFAYLSFRSAHGFWQFVVLVAAGMNGLLYLNAVGGVLIGKMVGTGSGGGRAYAGYRVWGSVGYIIVTLFSGWTVSRGMGPRAGIGRMELYAVFTYGPMLFFLIAVGSLIVPDAKRKEKQHHSTSAGLAEHKSFPKNFTWFLFSYFLYMLALYGASSYLSLFLKSLHARPLQINAVFAAGVVCEVLVMTRVGLITDIYGRRPALAIAFLLMPIRLLLYIPAHGPAWVMMVQTLHGLNFGIMGAIAVVFVNDISHDANRGAAQARLAAAGGLATALGPILCGEIVHRLSMGAMFAAMSIVGSCGAVVFLTKVHDSHPAPDSFAHRGHKIFRPLLALLVQPPSNN